MQFSYGNSHVLNLYFISFMATSSTSMQMNDIVAPNLNNTCSNKYNITGEGTACERSQLLGMCVWYKESIQDEY